MKEYRIEIHSEGRIRYEKAVFTDGSKNKPIKVDDRYGKYFEVDNDLNDDCKYFPLTFHDRIKDAIESIRNGNGDCIILSDALFKPNISVLYFIDRSIGEFIKNKTLDIWKNVEFCYAIKVDYNYCNNGYYLTDKNTETPMLFDTKESAKESLFDILNNPDKLDDLFPRTTINTISARIHVVQYIK